MRPGVRVKPGVVTVQAAEAINDALRRLAELESMLAPKSNGPPVYEKLVAKITAVSAGAYSWTEQFYTSTGVYEDLLNGRVGTPTNMPAYERNSLVATSFPFYAELTRRVVVDGSPVYEFTATAPAVQPVFKDDKGGSVTSGTHKINNSTVVDTAGVAVTTIDDAAAAAPGIISLSAQTLGDGDKSFKKSVLVNIDEATDKWLKATNRSFIKFLNTVSYFGIANSTTTATVATDPESIVGKMFLVYPFTADSTRAQLWINGLGRFFNDASSGANEDFLNRNGVNASMYKLVDAPTSDDFYDACVTIGDADSWFNYYSGTDPGAWEVRGLANDTGSPAKFSGFNLARGGFYVGGESGDAGIAYVQQDGDGGSRPTIASIWTTEWKTSPSGYQYHYMGPSLANPPSGTNCYINWGAGCFGISTTYQQAFGTVAANQYKAEFVAFDLTPGFELERHGIWQDYTFPGVKVAGGIVYDRGPVPSNGDIWYADTVGGNLQVQKLAIGTTGQVLEVAAGLPAWVTKKQQRSGVQAVTVIGGTTYTVTFSSAMPSANYSVTFGTDFFTTTSEPKYTNKTTTTFDIVLTVAVAGNVDWFVSEYI